MADEALQRWRRAAATGDAEAETRLLAGRVRAGELAPERLRLASYLGAPAARELAPLEQRGTWAIGLWEFGAEAVVRAGIAAARARIARVHDGVRTELALELLEAWLVEPDPRGKAALRARAEALAPGASELLRWVLRLFAEYERAGPRVVEGCFLPGPVYELMQAAEAAAGARPGKGRAARDSRGLAAATVRLAIRQELLPWCLGEGDPLRSRVGERSAGPRPQDPA